jgi:hypothetical protein
MTFDLALYCPRPGGAGRELDIPFAYERLLALYLSALIPDNLPRSIEGRHIPALGLDLVYRDLEGARHSKAMSVQLQLSHISSRDTGSDESAWVEIGGGRIEVLSA